MVLYIRLLSNDAEDFVLEAAVDDTATFMELHLFIQKSLNYDTSGMASFVITDNEWNRLKEISLIKMNDDDEDVLLMEETTLVQFLKEQKQRLLYVFDFFSERAFFIEVFDKKEGVVNVPQLLKLKGDIPVQFAIDDNLPEDTFDSEDEFSEGFEDIDDFDPDSFPDGY